MTPEGEVKAKIDKILNNSPVPLWYFKPVQIGYGKRALDYICCIAGRFVAIETKAPGKQPTAIQRVTSLDMFQSGAMVWHISNDEGIAAFDRWLRLQPTGPTGASW